MTYSEKPRPNAKAPRRALGGKRIRRLVRAESAAPRWAARFSSRQGARNCLETCQAEPQRARQYLEFFKAAVQKGRKYLQYGKAALGHCREESASGVKLRKVPPGGSSAAGSWSLERDLQLLEAVAKRISAPPAPAAGRPPGSPRLPVIAGQPPRNPSRHPKVLGLRFRRHKPANPRRRSAWGSVIAA